MNKAKFFLLATTLVFVLALTFSCDSSGNPSALVGRWIGVSGAEKDIVLELLSDGTGIITKRSKGLAISWKTENGRFYITNSDKATASNYKVQGSMLSFTDDKGETSEYTKCNNDCQEAAKEYAEAKDPGAEFIPAATTWVKMQQAYMMEANNIGDCKQIAYTPPGNGKTKNFSYSCKVENDIAYWIVENHNSLGKCSAGNQWILTMKKGDYEPEVYLPENKDCQELTPNFARLGKKGNARNKEEAPTKATVENNSSATPGKYPQASERLLTDSDLQGISKQNLRIMRNEIFARHGYIFKSDDLKEHFGNQSWYTPKYADVNSMLTSIEQKNVKFIQSYE